LISAGLAFATYWLLMAILSLLIRIAGTTSTVGNALTTLAVYLSPLLGGFPLLILLTVVFLVVLTKKGVLRAKATSGQG
jgi:hypothetical protein